MFTKLIVKVFAPVPKVSAYDGVAISQLVSSAVTVVVMMPLRIVLMGLRGLTNVASRAGKAEQRGQTEAE